MNNKKGEISIPKLFFNKEDFLISVIRGIFDTDGCLYLENKRGKLYPRIEFATTSFILSKQICKILQNFDLRVTNYIIHRKNENWNDLHKIVLRGDKMLRNFFVLINPGNAKHSFKFDYYRNNT